MAVDLALAFEKVVHEHLPYPGPTLLKKADRSLARVSCWHLLSTGQPAACGGAGAPLLALVPFSVTTGTQLLQPACGPVHPKQERRGPALSQDAYFQAFVTQ